MTHYSTLPPHSSTHSRQTLSHGGSIVRTRSRPTKFPSTSLAIKLTYGSVGRMPERHTSGQQLTWVRIPRLPVRLIKSPPTRCRRTHSLTHALGRPLSVTTGDPGVTHYSSTQLPPALLNSTHSRQLSLMGGELYGRGHVLQTSHPPRWPSS